MSTVDLETCRGFWINVEDDTSEHLFSAFHYKSLSSQQHAKLLDESQDIRAGTRRKAR